MHRSVHLRMPDEPEFPQTTLGGAARPRTPLRAAPATFLKRGLTEVKSEWSVVRLELGRTPEFPEGSASRAYLLRLPLDGHGLIDGIALAQSPALATVRRFWPNEADLRGYVVRKGKGWAFSYAMGEDDDEDVYHLEVHPLRPGEYVTVTEPDGERYPFKVVSSQPDGVIV